MTISLTKTSSTYNFDASALIIMKNWYPISRFAPLWKEIEFLFESNKAYIVKEVYEELMSKDDELAEWIRSRKSYMVIDLNIDEYQKAREILSKHPTLEDENATKTIADPYVVAHSIQNNTVVVSGEHTASLGRNRRKAKIPNVCDDYGVEHITGTWAITKLFEELDLVL